MATRVSNNIINPNDVKEILELNESNITTDVIMELFGEFNEKQRFHPYDTITIPEGVYGKTKKNKNKFKTTIGLWIFNRFMIEQDLSDDLGYINHEINKKEWNKIIDIISCKVLEDDLDIQVLHTILKKSQLLMPMATFLTPTMTDKFLSLPKYLEPKKKELFKKYEKELDAGDLITAKKVETELINYALDYLKDDPSLDIYLSGARSIIDNDFKNMYICKGMIADPDPNAKQQFRFAKSCYNDGISKEEYSLFANDLAAGPFSRARKTAIGGYWENLFTVAYQDVVLGKPGSDCKTKDSLEIYLTEKNVSDWMYSNIVTNNGLVELNSKNKNKYIGSKVKIRFAAFCESKDCICNACAGNLFYKLNYTQIGLSMLNIASKIKNINMKSFHDSTIKTTKINPKEVFGV